VARTRPPPGAAGASGSRAAILWAMKVALVQHDVVWEDAETTRAQVGPLIERGAAAGAEVVVLPEMFAVGFSMNTGRIAEPEPGPTAAWLADIAASRGVALIAGVPARVGDRFENRLLVVDAAGRIAARYAKIHPFTFAEEDAHYAPGREAVCCRDTWDTCCIRGTVPCVPPERPSTHHNKGAAHVILWKFLQQQDIGCIQRQR